MTNSTIETLRKNIKKYRLASNLTQEKLSEISGISSDYLSEIERGKRTPSLKRIILIAKALGIEPYQLLKKEIVYLLFLFSLSSLYLLVLLFLMFITL